MNDISRLSVKLYHSNPHKNAVSKFCKEKKKFILFPFYKLLRTVLIKCSPFINSVSEVLPNVVVV